MQTFTEKIKGYYISLLASLFFMTFTIWSCKKDAINDHSLKTDLINYYAAQPSYKNSLFSSSKPNWNTLNFFQTDSNLIAEIELYNPKSIAVLSDTTKREQKKHNIKLIFHLDKKNHKIYEVNYVLIESDKILDE